MPNSSLNPVCSVRRLRVALVVGLAVLVTPYCLRAQTIDVPRSAVPAAAQSNGQSGTPAGTQPGGQPDGQSMAGSSDEPMKVFDTSHMADRPYTFAMPKPAFPATDRVQRQFVVEYVYDYALTTYTPQVAVPTVAHAAAKQDTPEAAFIAFFSAARQGDYDSWITYWDEAGQKELAAQAKDQKQDAAYWRKVWAQFLPQSVPILLERRIETQNYVILDARLGGAKPFAFPTVLKFANGKWVVTNELSEDPMLYRFRATLAGSLDVVPPMPIALLDQKERHQIEAQQKFLNDHAVRSKVVEAGH